VREAGWHRSDALGLELRAERWLLRFHDPLRGRQLLTHTEISEELEVNERKLDHARRDRYEAVQRAEAEATQRRTAERERDAAVREREAANQRIRELEARLRLSDKSA